MTLKDLIGYQIQSIDTLNNTITVSNKEGKLYTLSIVEDEGDCCGFNTYEISTKDISGNPVITNVTIDTDEYDGGETARVTFYGEHKKLCTIDSESGSGSGWAYGACVTIQCKPLKLYQTITAW